VFSQVIFLGNETSPKLRSRSRAHEPYAPTRVPIRRAVHQAFGEDRLPSPRLHGHDASRDHHEIQRVRHGYGRREELDV